MLRAFIVLSRCHRCLALLYTHTVFGLFAVGTAVQRQRLQHLCLPLLEAARSPLHLHAGNRPGGRGSGAAFGTFPAAAAASDGWVILIFRTHRACPQQKYNTSAVDQHPLMCVQVRRGLLLKMHFFHRHVHISLFIYLF